MLCVTAVALAVLTQAAVAASEPPSALAPLSFLVGEWTGAGAGQPGAAGGTATFSRELQGRVIVRRSFAESPAMAGRPASRHDDLMVVYASPTGGIRADYFDNEGHVIRYTVTSPAAGQAVFVSDAVAGAPRFRLRYELQGRVLDGEFAIAPPGSDSFKPYLTWQSTLANPK